MRILIGADTWSPDVNGACYAARRLADGLAARGHEVHVVAPSRGLRSRPARSAGRLVEHRVRSLPVPRPARFRVCPPVGLRREVARILRSVRPDVVHVQSHLLLGRALLSVAARAGVPALATTHVIPENLLPALRLGGAAARWFSRLFWWDAARVLARAGLVTAPTPPAAALAERHGVGGPVVAVSNGLDLDRFRPDPGGRGARFRARHRIDADAPLVGFVGRLDREKHFDHLIRALPAVRDSVPGARLLVVGSGEEAARLRAVAADTGVHEAVTFTGRLPDDEIPDVYRAVDVVANAGTAELQSLVTLEAMATARPVVAVDAGALPELVHEGENGWRWPHGDIPALAGRLVRVLGEPRAAAAMGAAGRRLAQAHALDATLDVYEGLYHRRSATAVGQRGGRSAPRR